MSRIVSEAAMLDIRNLAVGLKARYISGQPQPSLQPYPSEPRPSADPVVQHTKPIDLSSGKTVISLQDMIDTTIALKTNLDVEVIQPTSQWPHSLFTTTAFPSAEQNDLPPMATLEQDPNSLHVAQAISGLQREVLLLRNDLNFELWLSRENSKHIARLYQDRILMKTAETERQGLVGANYLRSQCIHSPFFCASITSFENIAGRSLASRRNYTNIKFKQLARRASMLIGTLSCRKS